LSTAALAQGQSTKLELNKKLGCRLAAPDAQENLQAGTGLDGNERCLAVKKIADICHANTRRSSERQLEVRRWLNRLLRQGIIVRAAALQTWPSRGIA
jgi:hypothetical protein